MREPFHPADNIDRHFHCHCERPRCFFPHCAARQNVNVTSTRAAPQREISRDLQEFTGAGHDETAVPPCCAAAVGSFGSCATWAFLFSSIRLTHHIVGRKVPPSLIPFPQHSLGRFASARSSESATICKQQNVLFKFVIALFLNGKA